MTVLLAIFEVGKTLHRSAWIKKLRNEFKTDVAAMIDAGAMNSAAQGCQADYRAAGYRTSSTTLAAVAVYLPEEETLMDVPAIRPATGQAIGRKRGVFHSAS